MEYEKAKTSIDESLKKLQSDYIDLLLIHQPLGDYYGTYRAMEEAYRKKKVRAIGVPLYACGGGTIPLLQQWLWDGMSMGSAAAFMITGPAIKITNLGAVKIVFGMRKFILYLMNVVLFKKRRYDYG